MSEQDKQNDPLERLFRKKSQEYNISYNEEDWLKLEHRLDERDQQKASSRRRWLVAAAIVMAFSILAYLTIENQMQINRLNNELSNVRQPTSAQPKNDESNSQSNKDNGLQPQPDNQSPSTSGQKIQQEKSNRKLASARRNTAEEPAGKKVKDQAKDRRHFDKYALPDHPLDISDASTALNDHFSGISAVKLKKSQNNNPALAATSHNEPPAWVNNRNKPKRNTLLSRVSLGLVMGPDLSTAGSISDFYNPGYKLGVVLDYNFNANWAVTAGLIRTRTRYTASGRDYRPPKGYLPKGIFPDETIGDCVLIDIPISVKYNFLHFSHSRFYTTAGISSYIMLNEKYRFEYYSAQAGAKQGWNGKTGTQYWMSNASFSVGYEFDLSNNWSLRAEPFLKIPLREVGWGKVDLYSMGTVVSLNVSLR